MSTKHAREPEPTESMPAAKKSRRCEYDEKTMSRMAKTGDLEGIKKALDDCGCIPYHGIVQYRAAAYGHLPILQLIYDKYVKGMRGSTCFRDEDEMQAAVRSGHEETIRWMCRNYRELFCLVEADDDEDGENDKVGPNDVGRAHGSVQSWLTSAKLWDLSRWAYTELGLEYDDISILNMVVKNRVDMITLAVTNGARVQQTELLDLLERKYPDAVREYWRQYVIATRSRTTQ
jgi:hypothetical protein